MNMFIIGTSFILRSSIKPSKISRLKPQGSKRLCIWLHWRLLPLPLELRYDVSADILWLGVSTAVLATAALPLVGLTPHRSIVSWLPFTLGSALGAGGSLQLPFGIVASSLEGNERIAASM